MIKYLLRCLTTTALFTFPAVVKAQNYQPSNRLPVEDTSQIRTQVLRNGNNFEITGGLSRGQTLFHSFRDFSVPTGGAANFINPTGNRDIISRVTGSLFSDINGLVNSNGANFLLINPNGIVFGTNAQLNVGRSFMASTANGVNLVDGSGRAITFGTNVNGDAPLLSIAPNVFFNVASLSVGGRSPGISNFGTLQTTNPGQYIGLIGGNVSMNGGKIVAPGGRVDLGGIEQGNVTVDLNGLKFSGNGLTRSDVSILNEASVSVSADRRLIPVDPVFFTNAISPGSSINIIANRINLERVSVKYKSNQRQNDSIEPVSDLEAGLGKNVDNNLEPIGKIYLNSTGDINISGSTIVNAIDSGAKGKNGGGIQIEGKGNLKITNLSAISTELIKGATGNAGDIDLNMEGDISLSDALIKPGSKAPDGSPSTISAGASGTGNSGKIKITTLGKLLVSNDDTIASSIEETGSGDSQGIEIKARELEVSNRGKIVTFANKVRDKTKTGNAGPIDITTSENITIAGKQDPQDINVNDPDFLSQISSVSFREGNSGKITIFTPKKLSVLNQGVIVSDIREGGKGDPQGINIQAGEIEILNQSRISSSVDKSTSGKAGNITIQTGNIKIEGLDKQRFDKSEKKRELSFISSNSNAESDGGTIFINATGNISLSNGGQILANSKSTSFGKSGGYITINSNQLNLDDGNISLEAASNTGGNINLTTIDRLLMQNNSSISTNSGSRGTGNGGNININSPLIIATPGNNDITANAYADSGGQVNITTDGLFGILYRPKGQASFSTNDITVSSDFGPNGNVEINTPGIDPAKGITELSIVPADASNQLSQVCSDRYRQNKLIVTGRGGIPPHAEDPLNGDVIWQDSRALSSPTATAPAIDRSEKLPPPAVGWVFDGKGKVRLIAAGAESQPTGTSVICPKGLIK